MSTNTCRPELLVDYADGELPSDQVNLLEKHLATCEGCRSTLAALHRSLELARQVWEQNEAGLANFAPTRRTAGVRLRGARIGAVAAAMLLLITSSLVWMSESLPPATNLHPAASETPADETVVAEFREQMERQAAAARLLAAARILARQPGGEKYAQQRYEDILSAYPETTAAQELIERKNRL